MKKYAATVYIWCRGSGCVAKLDVTGKDAGDVIQHVIDSGWTGAPKDTSHYVNPQASIYICRGGTAKVIASIPTV